MKRIVACYTACNEALLISESIRSVKEYVDAFVVIDSVFTSNSVSATHSSDDMRSVVERVCAPIPLTYVESDYNTLVKGDFAPGLESNFNFVINGLLENPSDAVLNENKNTLANLLKQQGYTDEGIKILIKKSIESVVKDRATIDMPGRAKSIINQVEVNNILGKANKLNSFYTK